MDGVHEAVHVFVVYVQQLKAGLREPTGIVRDNVSLSVFMKFTKPVMTIVIDRLRRAIFQFVLDCVEDLVPIRQLFSFDHGPASIGSNRWDEPKRRRLRETECVVLWRRLEG